VKPTWTSASFLLYLGMFVGLFSLFAFLDFAEGDQGAWALLLASAVALVLVIAAAEELRRRREPLAAGLLSFVAVFLVGIVAGSFLDLIGLFPDESVDSDAFFTDGFAFGFWLALLTVLVSAIYARGRFAFPLHTLTIAAVVWYWVIDVLEGILGGGDTATAILAILVGLAFVSAGAGRDTPLRQPNAFWLHLVGGLSVGGGLLWFWHEHTWEWLLVIVVAVAYVAVARRLGRSSYAVLGAVGLAAATTYLVGEWFSLGFVPFFEFEPDENADWGVPLVFLVLGVVYMLLGWLVGHGRDRQVEPAA
jgi:hypothetical protein